MNSIQTETYTLPAYWASYLVNGDASGLNDGEQAEIDGWMKKNNHPIFTADIGESYFSWHNDANRLGGDVCDYVAILRDGGAK